MSRIIFPVALAAFLMAFVAVNQRDVRDWLADMRYGPWVCAKCHRQSVYRTAHGNYQCVQCLAKNPRPFLAAD